MSTFTEAPEVSQVAIGNRSEDCREAEEEGPAPRRMQNEEEQSSAVAPENGEEPSLELSAKGSEIEAEASLAYEEAMKKARKGNEDVKKGENEDSAEFSFQFPGVSSTQTDEEEDTSCTHVHGANMSSPATNGACVAGASPMDDNVFSFPQEVLPSTPHLAPLTPPVLSQSGRPLASKPKSSLRSLSEDQGCQSIILCGHAGSRKNTLADKMTVDSPAVFTKVIQHTTRAPLQHEVEGKDFHFVSKAAGLRMMDQEEFAEYIFLKPEEKRNRFNAAHLHRQALHHEALSTDSPPRTPTIPSSMMSDGRRVDGSVLYGTSFQAIREARTKGPKCIVFAVSVEGGIQLREKGLAGQYILLSSAGSEDLEEVKRTLKPDVVIDISSDPYSTLLHKAISFIENTVTHQEAVFFTTQAQWDAVPEMVASPSSAKHSPGRSSFTSFVSYAQVLQHFQVADMTSELQCIQPEVQYSGLKAVSHKMFGPPRITGRRMKHERDLVFAIAQHKLDYTEPLHSAVLQTIFKKLTGGKESVDCPRFGSHWEVIGFQGSDPATDLRATGFLSLCHLLYLVDAKDRLTLAHKVYQLSKSSHNPFPFCVLCINITRITLAALREGYLTKECRREGAVTSVVSHFFVATLFYYYETYRRRHLTVHELGGLLHNVESFCKKNVRLVMQNLDAALVQLGGGAVASRHQAHSPHHHYEAEENDEVQFTDIFSVSP